MNTDNRNQEMYTEDMELQENNSNVGKRLAVGAAVLVGGAAVAGGAAAYAASTADNEEVQPELTAEDLFNAAGAGSDYEEPAEQPVVQEHTTNVIIEQPEPEPEPEVHWEESQKIYVDGELAMQSESGNVDGHDFIFVDGDGDGYADVFAYDQNKNGQYEENEITELSREDGIQMGHETETTNNHYFTTGDNGELIGGETGGDSGLGSENPGYYPEEPTREMIHNNFEDEKTGESYSNDFAQNNPDYNNNYDERGYQAGVDLETSGEREVYPEVDEPEPDYTASAEPEYEEPASDDMGYTADALEDASFGDDGSMDMGGEECLV